MTIPILLISDFAGTVMRDDGAVLAAYRSALTEFGIPFTEEDLSSRRGASKRGVFQELAGRALPESEVEDVAGSALASFEAALRQEYETGEVREIEGAETAMMALKGNGIKLALTSGFDRGLVDLLVERLGWGELFDCVLSGSDAPEGRPAPYLIYRAMTDLKVHDVSRVAVVGDTPLDLRAANNARAGWVIGVLSGAHSIETLGATPHTHLLESVATLPNLFKTN
jgi:phosphonatase-like hydrolase